MNFISPFEIGTFPFSLPFYMIQFKAKRCRLKQVIPKWPLMTGTVKWGLDGTGGCKYTRSFKPVKIAQSWQITGGKSEAMKIERNIKKLTREEKEKLIKFPEAL